MILFFQTKTDTVIAVKTSSELSKTSIEALQWLFSDATLIPAEKVEGSFIGPRREMITPWSTTAVEITENMNITGIERIEEFFAGKDSYDKMLQRQYEGLDQEIFTIDKEPEKIVHITDLESYNKQEGLALSPEEIAYLKGLADKLGRPLTDSEVFGFSQVNSEHCRHKIFNGTFIIDGKEMESSLFKMIKKTSSENPGRIVSAYKDNCAFIDGPVVDMFHPASGDKPDFFGLHENKTVISLKAETHNFPTTVEPFNGAATGSGGEIRDRIAGGKGSFPIAGTAVYMTSYPRFEEGNKELRTWEQDEARPWLYQTPQEILIKASNGASDFGNKFGQPVITGSLQTLEHTEDERKYGFDKVIMLAGGIGYAKKKDSLKETPEVGDKIVLLGGDNYRIGMGGGAVSSVATGEYGNAIELNAIQRSNPEMQKRAYNAIRAISEKEENTIISVHDHGAGGHLNCLSELVEELGGNIDIEKLPIGDPTLSAKEIIGNESQERMGLVMKEENVEELHRIAERERAPFYVIGETTGKHNFTLKNNVTGETPIDLELSDMFGSTPKTVMTDESPKGGADGRGGFKAIDMDVDALTPAEIETQIAKVLSLESVACKDWLTNKVDRSVTGLIACQQTCGEIQLPLNNLGVTAIGYQNKEGIATSIGHAPMAGLIDPAAGSRIAISEALTNMVWTPIKENLTGVSLSANWMWPCKNDGENARLYSAVKGASDFAIALGVNIPTGKDSMSMTQKYPNGDKVLSPGTVIISTVGESEDVYATIHPVVQKEESTLYYIPFTSDRSYPLGGSAFAQTIKKVGAETADVKDPEYFKSCFNTLQDVMFRSGNTPVLAGHDVSAGGLATTLLEMCFANVDGGLDVDLTAFESARILFSEVPAVVVQVKAGAEDSFVQALGNVAAYKIGKFAKERCVNIALPGNKSLSLDIDKMRDVWFETSYLFDVHQVGKELAKERYTNYKNQPLQYSFPAGFTGKYDTPAERKHTAAIIREKGSNGDREMAWALYMAGFNVKDVHMTDLITGRETLEDVNMIVFVGGFSNADTLGSAKGWAGAFQYNEKAKKALENFYSRKDTLSLGVCNGCQLMAELGLITYEERERSPKMKHNDSHKYESAFVGVQVENSPAVLLSSLTGSKLGIWVAHGEGKFSFPESIDKYNVALRYTYNSYPANPNGSPEGIAGVCSQDGRHLAMMPHPERCLRPWNWAHYPYEKRNEEVTPWIELFINGKKWLERQ
ncbi:MAG: phosphoribosylformylglycinamidine synthase [Bacteroidales bacterium]|nr:phosphoribosylformylglycinamidine synthase [Bacteroidales bacterium]